MQKNVVDSSGWLEYFADAGNADFFASAIEDEAALIVPVITIYEVFKRICQQRDEDAAFQATALMQQGRVIDLDSTLSLAAVQLSLKHKLPMADSLILATAYEYNATLWTQDADFANIPNVQFLAKTP